MAKFFKLLIALIMELVNFVFIGAWLSFKLLLITIFFFAKKKGNAPVLNTQGQKALDEDFKNLTKSLRKSFVALFNISAFTGEKAKQKYQEIKQRQPSKKKPKKKKSKKKK